MMLSIHVGLVLLMVLSVSSQRYARYFDEEVIRGDEFIDNFIKDMIYDHGHEYDPYYLEDSVVGFSKKIMYVNVSGEAKLHNGYITGLKSLHRSDHCSYNEENGRVYVTADLAAGVLDFHYDGTVKFMNFGPTISMFGKVPFVETHMEFDVDAKTGTDGELKKFYIEEIKGMEVWISGLGPLNWAANYLIGSTTSLFKGFIRNMLEKKVRSHVAERLPNYKFPVNGAEGTETSAPDVTEVPEASAPKTQKEIIALAEKLLSEILKF